MNLVMLVVAASVKGSILLALAWAVTRIFRRMSAAARHLIWAAALGGMLSMPLFMILFPSMKLAVIPRLPVTASITTTAPANVVAQTSSPAPNVATNVAPSSTPTARAAAPPRTIDLVALVPLLWGIGAALLLLRLAVGTLRVSMWTRRAHPVDDGSWLALVQRIAARLGITRPVILLRSERACVPMTWGVVYPTVLLPIDADEWNAERRTIVLLHELAHVKRLDAFTQLVAQVAIGVFWFNPLVWLAACEMRTEREHACDDFVLQGGARASDYAHDLLQIARSLGASSAPAAAALAMARRSEFEGRLLAILDPKTDRRSVSRARLALATLGVVALSLPLAALAPAPRAVAADVSHTEQVPAAPPAAPATPASFAVAAPKPSAHAVQLAGTLARQTGKQAPPPDRETLIAVAKAAAKMTSSYEKAELLITIAKYYLPDDELRTIYLEAVSTMTSDYDQSRTLAPLLAKDSALPAKAVGQVVSIATKMSSDYEKANLIINTIGDGRLLLPEARTSMIAAMSSISSSYDRRRAVTAMVKRGEFNADDAIGLINVAALMSSSYDKAEALIEIATHSPLNDPGVRKAYFKAAESISSSTDYRRAMAAVLK